jgi:hypothetical protein
MPASIASLESNGIAGINGLVTTPPLEALIVAPDLATWLSEVVLHNLRSGAATATTRFWRGDNGRSHAEILEKSGTLRLNQPAAARVVVRQSVGSVSRVARHGRSLDGLRLICGAIGSVLCHPTVADSTEVASTNPLPSP